MPSTNRPSRLSISRRRTALPRAAAATVEQLELRTFLSASAFLPAVSQSIGLGATSIASGDFNDDGTDDIVAAGPAGVVALLSNDAGGFGSPVTLSHGGAASVAVGDFTGDGEDDVAFISASGSLTVRPGNGDGTFGGAIVTHASSHASAIATGDFDDDGNLDLAIAGGDSGGAVALFGRGDGHFHGAVKLADSGSFTAVAVGDLNGDYTDDIAIAGPAGVQFFTSNDDGTFAGATSVTGGAAADDGSIGLAIDDFNYDGNGDIAVTNASTGSVDVLLGQIDPDTQSSAGTFDAPVSYAVGGTPASLTVGDVDGDYNTDLIVADAANNSLAVLGGAGDGTFADAASYAVGQGPTSAVVGDFTGDGIPDLASADSADNAVSIIAKKSTNLAVSISAEPTATIHQNYTYTITVKNNGSADAANVVLYDYLPADATIVSTHASAGSIDTADGSLTANLGDLAAGDTATITIVVKPTTFGLLYSSASVSTDTPVSDYSEGYASTQTQVVGASGAEVELTQSTNGGNGWIYPTPIVDPIGIVGVGNGGASSGGAATGGSAGGTVDATTSAPTPSTAKPAVSTVSGIATGVVPNRWWWGGSGQIGKDLVYTLTVTNHGPESAGGLVLTDTLPADATFVSATSTAGTVNTSVAGKVTVDLGDLAVGATATITITVNPTKAGTITNVATVEAADSASDPFTDNNTSSLDTSVYDPSSPQPVWPIMLDGSPVPSANGAAGGGGALGAPSGGSVNPTASPTNASITVSNATADEGNVDTSNLVFTVTRTGDTSTASTVHFATAGGTAKAGKDFLSRRGKLTFRPGVSSLTVKVPVKGDTKVESNESLSLNLTDPTNATLATADATGTITNDDTKTKPHHHTKTPDSPFAHKIRIQFATASSTVAKGFQADTGAIYGPRASGLNFGWDIDNTANAVERNVADSQKHDTFNVLGGNGGASQWEIELPNGKYKVRLVAGDPAQIDPAYEVDAEGTPLLSGTPGRKHHHAISGKQVIDVQDGKLTLTAGAGSVDKLQFIEISPAK